jgi:hypothetical protein
VRREAHVGAIGTARTVRDPELAEETQHVVDPQRAGVPERGAQQPDPEVVAIVVQLPGIERRQPPVLAHDGEVVGRSADAHALEKEMRVGPDVGAARGGADGEILVEPDAEAGAAAPLGGRAELAVELVLEPAVEVHLTGVRATERRHLGGARIAVRLGPAAPIVLPQVIDQRLEGGEAVERLSLGLDVPPIRPAASAPA